MHFIPLGLLSKNELLPFRLKQGCWVPLQSKGGTTHCDLIGLRQMSMVDQEDT